MMEYEESRLEKPLEKKPTERYLGLISSGMARHGVDDTYVQDEIMACPYIPKRPREDWYTFPTANGKEACSLRTIRFAKYQKLCRTAPPTVLYFILHQHVMKITLPETSIAENPAVQWMKSHPAIAASCCGLDVPPASSTA